MENHYVPDTSFNVEEFEKPVLSERMTFHGQSQIRKDIVPVTDLGGGLRLLSERKMELTIAKANEILLLPEFIVEGDLVDRGLRDNHVNYLVNCMKRGSFRPEFVAVITCICLEPIGDNPAGTEYRMNSQHVCSSRLLMPSDWPCQVKAMKYEGVLIEDMRMLYSSIDRNAPRTKGHVITAHLAGTEQFRHVPNRIIKVVASALPMWLWESSKHWSTHDGDEIAYLLKSTHHVVANYVTQYLHRCPKDQMFEQVLRRTPVVASMFETFSKLPTKAYTFWDVVRDGIGSEDNKITGLNDPRVRLHNALLSSVIGQSSFIGHVQAKGGKKSVPSETMYRWCIQCWNSWRKGEDIKGIKAAHERPKAR